jgi:hypothetical protein
VIFIPEKIDPKGRDLDTFMNLLGCFGCEKKNNGNGVWPSKEAIVYCEEQKTDMRRAYENGTPLEPFECEYKTSKPIKSEPVLV